MQFRRILSVLPLVLLALAVLALATQAKASQYEPRESSVHYLKSTKMNEVQHGPVLTSASVAAFPPEPAAPISRIIWPSQPAPCVTLHATAFRFRPPPVVL